MVERRMAAAVRRWGTGRYPIRPRSTRERMELTCGKCGITARYDVGAIVAGGEGRGSPVERRFSFTGYFRCVSCDGSGPWELPPRSLVAVTVLVAKKVVGEEAPSLRPGPILLYDGTPIGCPAEGEDILRARIAADPGNALLWNRLANLFLECGRTDLAREAFEKALELDPDDVGSHHSLGRLLFEAMDLRGSAAHFRGVLRGARKAAGTDPDLLRCMVMSSLDHLETLREETGGEVGISPFPDS